MDRNGIMPGFEIKAGILMLVGDVRENPFIIGVTPFTGFGICNPAIYIPAEIRFGRLLTRHFYLTGNLGLGIPLGYNFGPKRSRASRTE